MATIPRQSVPAPDQDAEPTTPDGEQADRVHLDDTAPGSDPDPEPGGSTG